MKKFGNWLIVVLLFTIICQIAFCGEDLFNLSPDALKLNKEQKSCKVVFECFFGGYAYNDLVPVMASTLKKDMTNETYYKLKGSLKNAFGDLKNPRFSMLQKVNQFDRIVYIAEGKDSVLFEVIYVFTTENKATLLTEFAVRPLQQPTN